MIKGMMRHIVWRMGAVCAVLTALTACGGGGGGGGGGTTAPTPLPAQLTVVAPEPAELGQVQTFGVQLQEAKGLSYVWDFGDGTRGAGLQITHQYADAGDFAASFTVRNEAGQELSSRFHVIVNRTTALAGLDCTGGKGKGWCMASATPLAGAVQQVQFADAKTGWAADERCAVARSTDAGQTWRFSARAAGARNPTLSTPVTADRLALLCGFPDLTGVLLLTRDGGRTWAQFPVPSMGINGSSLWWLSDEVLYYETATYCGASGCFLKSYRSADGGKSWVEMSAAADLRVIALRQGDTWAYEYAGAPRTPFPQRLMVSTDQGATWGAVLSLDDIGAAGVQLLEDGTLVVADKVSAPAGGASGSQVRIRLSRDRGAHWTAVLPSGLPLTADNPSPAPSLMSADAQGRLWLEWLGQVYVSKDFGNSFTPLLSPSALSLSSGKISNLPGSMLLDDGWWTANWGESWRKLTLRVPGDTFGRLNMLGGGDASTLLMSSASGRLYGSEDGGTTWQVRLPSQDWLFARSLGEGAEPRGGQQDFLALSPVRLLKLDLNWGLQLSTDGGVRWETVLSNVPPRAGGLRFVDQQKVWLLDSFGVLHRSTDGGAHWSEVVTPRAGAIHALATTGADGLWVQALEDVLFSDDAGKTWHPAAPHPLEHDGRLRQMLAFSASEVLVSVNATLAATRDGGKTWQALPKPLGDEFIVHLAKAGAQDVWAIGEAGGLAHSTDAGRSWKTVTTPGSRTQWRSITFTDAEHGWLVGERGRVLATRDAGQTWTEQVSELSHSLMKVQFIDSRTGWMLSDRGEVLATGTGGQ